MTAVPIMGFDIYQPAIPAVMQAFNTTQAYVQLTMSVYLLILGLGQLLWGPLLDHYGRRKILTAGLTLFMLATIWILLAHTIQIIIIGRALQGLGGCALTVIAFASTRDIDNDVMRAKTMSHLSMTMSVSPILAPIVGAFLFKHFGWQSNFIALLISALYVAIYAYFKLNESKHFEPQGKLTLNPVLARYKDVITHGHFWGYSSILVLCFSALMAFVVNAAYLMITRIGLSPTLFSILLGANALLIIAGNYIGIRLRRRWSMENNITLGASLIVFGGLLQAILMFVLGFNLISLAPITIVTLGAVMMMAPANALVLQDFAKNAGTASSVCNSLRVSGSAAVAGIIGAFLGFNLQILPLAVICCGALALLLNKLLACSKTVVVST